MRSTAPILRSEEGFSIIQAVIGMGIAAAAALYMAQMNEQSAKTVRNATLTNDYLILSTYLTMSLGHESSCSEIFAGAELSGTKVATAAALKDMTPENKLKAIRPSAPKPAGILAALTVRGSELATRGKSRGGLKFTRLDLEARPGDPALVEVGDKTLARYLTVFILEAEKEGQTSGVKTITKEFPVSLLVDPTTGKVAGCAGDDARTFVMTDSVRQEFCGLMGLAFNAQTQKCAGAAGDSGGGYGSNGSGGSLGSGGGAFGSAGAPSSNAISAAARSLMGNAGGNTAGAGGSGGSIANGGAAGWDAKAGKMPEPPSGDIQKAAPAAARAPAALDGLE